jgi:predicted  nucleic acid-binding Zn-ribbon protein
METSKIVEGIKSVFLPEFNRIGSGLDKIEGRLDELSQRMGDLNQQQIYIGQRIDETNNRIDSVREELTQRIDSVREYLTQRIDDTNKRLDRLYEVVVRKDEHIGLKERVADLERKYEHLERQISTG